MINLYKKKENYYILLLVLIFFSVFFFKFNYYTISLGSDEFRSIWPFKNIFFEDIFIKIFNLKKIKEFILEIS